MKTILLSLLLLAVGAVAGYYSRTVIAEDRMQSNLASLSGETLAQLDAVGRSTRGFSSADIERRSKEYADLKAAGTDLVALKEAWQAWERAIIYRGAERVGWSSYRPLIIQNSARYLKIRSTGGFAAFSQYGKREVTAAETMIRESIPQEALSQVSSLHQ